MSTVKANLEVKHSFMKEISEAVSHLHQNKIVHRDIKPQNILVAPDGQGKYHPKLAEFDMAEIMTDSTVEDEHLTMDDRHDMSISLFMAPEVPTGHYNEKADVFSMGVLFRAMLFNRYVPLDSQCSSRMLLP
ncbi:serine/threonine-protein kinase pdik1l-B-like [Amphiura filiformis]|uniref:serine/threonine-protein kinase pdik1l-B-like n=1 Tax=Amphiura filiformis TaxID=82378 RepID=UPI003B21A513